MGEPIVRPSVRYGHPTIMRSYVAVSAYGNAALGKVRVHEGLSHFKHGEMSIENQPCSGRPSTLRT